MKNTFKLFGIMLIALVLMFGCKEEETVLFENWDDLAVGEWILVDKDDVVATDNTATLYDEDENVEAYCIQTIYFFGPNEPQTPWFGSLEQTFQYVEDGAIDIVTKTFSWYLESNQLTMSWEEPEEDEAPYIKTGVHFNNDNVLFWDYLHNDVREDQTHLNRVQ
jgi:hypothetical protein